MKRVSWRSRSVYAHALFMALALFALPKCAPKVKGKEGQKPSPTQLGFPKATTKAPMLKAETPWGEDPQSWSGKEPSFPLEVLFHSPKKTALGTQAILVTFNQPMIRLGKVKSKKEDPSRYPIHITPPIDANYRWVAGDTLKVAPKKPLQRAQKFSVMVPKGVQSLSGSKLEENFTWSFETERPRIRWVSVLPQNRTRADRIYPTDYFELYFNLKVDPKAIKDFVKITANDKPVAFSLKYKPPEKSKKLDKRILILRPQKPLPKEAEVLFYTKKGMKSMEGPLPSNDTERKLVQVFSPLRGSFKCDTEVLKNGDKCIPMHNDYHQGLYVHFNEPVTRKMIVKTLRAQPRIPGLEKRLNPVHSRCGYASDSPCSRMWRVNGALKAAAEYRLSWKSNLRDIFGQKLSNSPRVSFKTTDYPPGIFTTKEAEGYREPWHPYKISTVNTKSVHVRRQAFSGHDLIKFLICLRQKNSDWPKECWKNQPKNPTITFKTKASKNRITSHKVPLPQGLVAVKLTSPEVVDYDKSPISFYRVTAQTNLGIHVRMTPFGLVVWTTSLDEGKSVPGAEVRIYDEKGRKIAQEKSNSYGVSEFRQPSLVALTKKKRPPLLYVHVSTKTDEAYRSIAGRKSKWRWSTSVRDTPYHACYRYGCFSQIEWDYPKSPISRDYMGSYVDWIGNRPQLVGYISAERGIYRPGQTIFLHGAIRRYNEWHGYPYAKKEISIKLESPSGNVLKKATIKTDEAGVFLHRFQLASKGRLGNHRLILEAGDKHLGARYVRVAEYRPPRFEVKLHLTQGESPNIFKTKGLGQYLFGGSMGKAKYRLSLSKSTTYLYAKNHKGFRVGRLWSDTQSSTTLVLDQGKLSKEGSFEKTHDLSSKLKGPRLWPTRFNAELEVTSSSGRSVAGYKSLLQHPGDLYVAIRSLSSHKQFVRRRVKVLTPKWKTRPNHEVTATLYPTISYSKADYSKTLWKKTFSVPKEGYTLKIPWKKEYRKQSYGVLILSVKDKKGRLAKTSELIYRPNWFMRYWYQQREKKEKRQSQLTVTTDKNKYLPGDTATITVKRKGLKGSGMLFVERERTFLTRPLSFDSKGKATISLKVSESMAPTVTLRAVVVRKGKALRNKMGPLVTTKKTLTVSEKPFQLQVDLKTDRENYKPRENVKVSIQVIDGLKRKRKCRVVLMAVDEAVLRLTNYKLPNPLSALLHTPPNQLVAADLRRHLKPLDILLIHRDHIELTRPVGGSGGLGLGGSGSGGGGGQSYGMGGLGMSGSKRRKKKKRRQFTTTPWHTAITTDENGKARASFKLPDNLTQYRIMAFALDDKRSAGVGRTRFKVNLPLITLPSLPRFAREGDEFSGGVTVYNRALPKGKATVRVSVKGDHMKLVGKNTKRIQLSPGKDTRVEFGFKAIKFGVAKVEFEVEMGKTHDGVSGSLPIKRATFTEAASVSGQTKTAVLQGMEKLSKLRPDYGGLEIALASTALVGIEDGMEQLIDYPYGCLEQQSSRLLPMIVATVMGKRFNFSLKKKPIPLIRKGLSSILAMQRGDGGFGYWPGSHKSWAWTTAYALIVLKRLALAEKTTGIPIPKNAVRRALKYLDGYQKNIHSLGYYWWSYESFVLYAMSLYKKDITKKALELFRTRKHRPLFARAMLLASMARWMKHKKEKKLINPVATLTEEIADSLRVDSTWAHAEEQLSAGYKVLMHSNDRTTAMVLVSLLEAQPSHPMVPRLVRWFLLGRKQARFRNTQEAAWALMALWDYARILEKEVPNFEAGVWMGKTRLVKAYFKGRSSKPLDKKIPMSQLLQTAGRAAQDLVLAKRGVGTLYYVARLRYSRVKLPEKARDHGFKVERSITLLDGGGSPLKNSRRPRFGDTVLVTLKVNTTEARRYVVVEDPLPAGLEALDDTLKTSSKTFGAGQLHKSSYFDHRELRDDRALFFRDHMQPGTHIYRYLAKVTTEGKFITPPTKAEEMYTPEVFGHTPSRTVSFK